MPRAGKDAGTRPHTSSSNCAGGAVCHEATASSRWAPAYPAAMQMSTDQLARGQVHTRCGSTCGGLARCACGRGPLARCSTGSRVAGRRGGGIACAQA